MTEPLRLLDDERHPMARALLGAGQADAPPEGAAGRALVALGVAGAATTVATGAAAATTALSAGTGAAAGGKTAAGVSLAVLAKWAGGGVVLGLVVSAVALPDPPRARHDEVPSVALQRRPAAAQQPTPARAPVAPLPGPKPDDDSRPRAAVAPSLPRPPAPAPSASAASNEPAAAAEDRLSGEVALVDSARKALMRGDSAGALGLLERHRKEYPAGSLGPEAFVLRLEAMVRSGRSSAARDLAKRYLERNPQSPHASAIRRIAGW